MKRLLATLFILLVVFQPAIAGGIESIWIEGYRYYPLYSVCREKNIDYSWDSIGRIAILKKNGVELKMFVGSDKLLIDGISIKDIGPPVYFYNGMVLIPGSFATRELDRIFEDRKKIKRKQDIKSRIERPGSIHTIKTVVIDPGHGGKDPGAIGRYYRLKEKDINLDIAKRLKRLLTSHGITVYLTRTKDIFVSLPQRAEFANKKNADFFISIHTNSSRSRYLRGFEIYYLSEGDDSNRALNAARSKGDTSVVRVIEYDMKFRENRRESRELSEYLIKYAKTKNIYVRRRSLRNARFHILRNFKTDMPAVLVEVGYISNRKDEGLLRLSSYRDRLASALLEGVLAYKKEYESTNGFTR